MGTNTTKLGLLKPSENDFYNQQTEQAENWEKVDKFADDIQNLVDNNSGKKITGYIQDSGEKILGNYYLDKLATGLFKCIKSGDINYNSSEYFKNYSNYENGEKINNLGTTLIQRGVKSTGIISQVGGQEFLKIVFPKPFKTAPIVVASISTHSHADPIDAAHTNDDESVHVYLSRNDYCMVKWIMKKQGSPNGRKINWIAVGEHP